MSPWQLASPDSLDDVRHQGRFGRVILGDSRAIRPGPVDTVDAGIRQVNRNALIIHEVTSSGTTLGVSLVPGPVQAVIRVGLWAFQLFRSAGLRRIDLQSGRKIFFNFVGDLAGTVHQILTRIQTRNRSSARLVL